MPIVFLSLWIMLLFIRPMDWYEESRGDQLILIASVATLLVGVPWLITYFPSTWKRVPQLKIAVGLLIATMLSYLPVHWFGGMIVAFQQFGKVILLFFLIVVLSRERGHFRILLWCIVACVTWMAIHGCLQVHQGVGFGNQKPLTRTYTEEGEPVLQIMAFGIFQDPNDLCLVFILAIPLLYSEFRVTGNIVIKGLCLGLIALCGYGAYLTNSRGGYVGIFGMVTLYVLGRLKGFRRWVVLSIAVALIVVVAPARVSGGMSNESQGRTLAWGNGIAAWRTRPILGVGWNNYNEINDGWAAHNSYICSLTELGLVGYVPFMFLIVLTFQQLWRCTRLRDKIDKTDMHYLNGLLAANGGYFTSIYFLSRNYNPVLYILLGMSICMVMMVCRDPQVSAVILGNVKRDLKRGVIWILASIPFFWLSIRVANAVSGGR